MESKIYYIGVPLRDEFSLEIFLVLTTEDLITCFQDFIFTMCDFCFFLPG